MNYYKQVAEMLGVELNEEFNVAYSDDVLCENPYKITVDGLLYKNHLGWVRSSYLLKIIEGDLEIVKIPWKPKDDEFYYYYSPCTGITYQERWVNTASDYCMWKIGNCFRTREEAAIKGKEIMETIEKEFRKS
mgnify:CR=1 FL=1|nr:MAG TPA: hypothetical protein [Caudoviricetes sp.]